MRKSINLPGHLLIPLGISIALGMSLSINSAIAADIKPLGSFTFFGEDGTLKITAKAKDGSTFEQEFSFNLGSTPTTARDLVKSTLENDGWTVKNSGDTGILIEGKGNSPIQEVNSGYKKLNPGTPPMRAALDSNSGVTQGEATVGGKHKFAFLPLNPNSTVLDFDGTLTAQLNGTLINTSVFTGQTPDQVAQQLFNAMLAASIPAELNLNEISFILDNNGDEVLSTDLILNAGGLEALTFIPMRMVVPVPEPSSTLGLLALGTLGAASTLKRKLKTSKCTEKELEKVG
jgi:hypothetical protein